MKTYYKDYLYGCELNSIDNEKLAKHCLDIEKMLLSNLPNVDYAWYGSLTTAHHLKYNLLTVYVLFSMDSEYDFDSNDM